MKVENDFRRDFAHAWKAARGASVYVQKHHGSMYSAGLPDVLVHDKAEGLAFNELKGVREVPNNGIVFAWRNVTDLQMATLLEIENSGAIARVVVFIKPWKAVVSQPARAVAALRRGDACIRTQDYMSGTLGEIAWQGKASNLFTLVRITYGRNKISG